MRHAHAFRWFLQALRIVSAVGRPDPWGKPLAAFRPAPLLHIPMTPSTTCHRQAVPRALEPPPVAGAAQGPLDGRGGGRAGRGPPPPGQPLERHRAMHPRPQRERRQGMFKLPLHALNGWFPTAPCTGTPARGALPNDPAARARLPRAPLCRHSYPMTHITIFASSASMPCLPRTTGMPRCDAAWRARLAAGRSKSTSTASTSPWRPGQD
jgi:hypothetical protein